MTRLPDDRRIARRLLSGRLSLSTETVMSTVNSSADLGAYENPQLGRSGKPVTNGDSDVLLNMRRRVAYVVGLRTARHFEAR